MVIWDIENGTRIGEYEGMSNPCILTVIVAMYVLVKALLPVRHIIYQRYEAIIQRKTKYYIFSIKAPVPSALI